MNKILLVDDDRELTSLLKELLDMEGFNVLVAHDGEQALALLDDSIDLLLLDVMMPKMDGWQVCREIRMHSKVPIIMLTAKDEVEDKVLGLDTGADDYLSKPFGIGELQARLRVALRRAGSSAQPEQHYQFSGIEVDLVARRINRGEEEIHLTPIEFRLLAVLLNNHGKVLTQRQLLSQVWGPNAVEHSHYLRIYMGHLRQKLEVDPARPRHLLTETGIGYRFML